MANIATSRLRKELQELKRKPVENVRACPKETNILEWHYVIEGPKGSVYEGGWYHGTVTFPKEYPYKPPSIQMITPNGRFKPNTRLCLSMSDFHPESWNPLWSVGTVLLGLYTFMLEESPTYGSIVTPSETKRKLAEESLEFNVKNKVFCELFPELVELFEERRKTIPPIQNINSNTLQCDKPSPATSWAAIFGILAAVIAFTWAVLSISI